MNKAEDIRKNGGIVRILLQIDQFHVESGQALRSLSQEFAQQIVHCTLLGHLQGMIGSAHVELALLFHKSWYGSGLHLFPAQGQNSRHGIVQTDAAADGDDRDTILFRVDHQSPAPWQEVARKPES